MKTKFSQCPHCKSRLNGSWVYECDQCSRIMCFSDGGWFGSSKGCWSGDRCPDCASHKKKDGKEIIKPIGIVYS